MPVITILCPFHRVKEQLDIPDSYGADFHGEVICGCEEYQARLVVKLVNSKVAHISVHPSELDDDDDDPGEPPPDYYSPSYEVPSYPSGYGPSQPPTISDLFADREERKAKTENLKADADLKKARADWYKRRGE